MTGNSRSYDHRLFGFNNCTLNLVDDLFVDKLHRFVLGDNIVYSMYYGKIAPSILTGEGRWARNCTDTPNMQMI